MQKSYIGKTHGRTMWLIEVLCNQKGCPIVLWIKGKSYAKNQGPDSRDDSYQPFEQISDNVACRGTAR